ncbi:hypothetical protein CRX10_23550 [Salmonella enterica subsp. enterica serovar Newport]|nr:hypothetical protein [Salmonella enterica subsp. enterica serovar Newport]EGU8719242.1 hypothetical protein [Salmonella enterica]
MKERCAVALTAGSSKYGYEEGAGKSFRWQVLLINSVTAKEAISRFCCRPILASKGKTAAHPEPEFLYERPEASGMTAIG